MPAESVRFESATSPEKQIDAPEEAGNTRSFEKRAIKEERGNGDARSDVSLLYTLAAAAASRTSTSRVAMKQEEAIPSLDRTPASRDPTPPTIKREKKYPSPAEDNQDNLVRSTRKQGKEVPTVKNSDQLNPTQHAFLLAPQDEINGNPAVQHANQLHLMEAMMQRQRQLYEEYGHSNWMKMQRNDGNCLSKSKAKRYRWCVQKNRENENANDPLMSSTMTSSTADYTNKKKAPMKRPSTNPMHDKLYGTVFTGASKFRCRDCGKSFTTLVDLTLHMNNTGHYRDENLVELKDCNDTNSKYAKPKKRSMTEMEDKSAEKVLKCLGCGHSFDSLQDLTVHMIKTKHYEDVPSLRLYSQKNEFSPPANGISHVTVEETPSSASPRTSSASFSDPTDAMKYPGTNFDQSTLNFMGQGAVPPGFAGQPNFANMLNMAALRLLGGFPPYFMQMPFQNAMSGYDMAGAAYTAAAARLFLSSPWLTQMPGLAPGSMFRPFMNPHTAMPPTILPQVRQQSPIAGDVPAQPTSVHSTAHYQRSSNRPSPSQSRTPNGNACDTYDIPSSKSHVLRCVQCGESFGSLQKMTDHMRETTHFPIAMTPPADETNHRRGSRCSSIGDSVVRASPQQPHPHRISTASSPQQPSVPTSSPLEQLARLACGKSLAETNTSRPKRDGNAKDTSSPVLSTSPHHSPNNRSLSGEGYICPDFPRKASDLPVTGFDFIKSLESTIQSAISRVNQPSTSPSLERQMQSQWIEQSRHQKSKKHNILTSFLSSSPRTHRKSLPDCCQQAEATSALAYRQEKSKVLVRRPASDGEEYYQGSLAPANGARKSKEAGNHKCNVGSPPLDLSKHYRDKNERDNEAQPSRSRTDSASPIDKSVLATYKNPVQCIKEELATVSECKARKRWDEKYPRPSSPSPGTNAKRPRLDREVIRSRGVHMNDYPLRTENSNPLKEMQKIVNATESALNDNKRAFTKQRNDALSRKRKPETEIHIHDQVKSYTPRSVLSDLVRHDDDSPPAVDPLAQMEHLVNLKIGQDSTLERSHHMRKSHLSKAYPYMPSEAATTPRNGTNPMSALLNLFTGNGTIGSRDRGKDVVRLGAEMPRKDAENDGTTRACATDTKVTNVITNSNGEVNDADKLKEKMTELLRNMLSQAPSFHERKTEMPSRKSVSPIKCNSGVDNAYATACHRDSSTDTTLSLSQELQLQKLFAEHVLEDTKDINVPDSKSKAVSVETGLSVNTIKEWVEDTKNRLTEKNHCGFVEISQSNPTPMFRCTSCAAITAQGLSARDFLRHLSTHISAKGHSRSPKRRNSGEECGPPRKKEWEMLYRGAMHFKPLNTEDSSPNISLTARVSDSPVETEYLASPTMDIVGEQRKRVDVVEDSPIKVS